MNPRSNRMARLKAFAAIECMAVMMALVLPVMPGKTGPTFDLPDVDSYIWSVFICFVMVNGILIVLAAVCWIYWVARGRPSQAAGESAE